MDRGQSLTYILLPNIIAGMNIVMHKIIAMSCATIRTMNALLMSAAKYMYIVDPSMKIPIIVAAMPSLMLACLLLISFKVR